MEDPVDRTGDDFARLDAREAQEALEDELSGEGDASIEEPIAAEDETGETDADEDADEQELAVVDAARQAEMLRMLEALIFAAQAPLDEKSIRARMPADAPVPELLGQLAATYENRGVNLKQTGGRWRFVTAPDLAPILEVEKIEPRRLSRAALETLAIIAYHQPCTRADIEDVRGVAVSKGSLDHLMEVGWVRLRGRRRDAPGRPVLYGTTDSFLDHFGLSTVQDLPGMADLKAAGLLDARLPPGFSVPTPTDASDAEEDADGDADAETVFSEDFLSEDGADNTSAVDEGGVAT